MCFITYHSLLVMWFIACHSLLVMWFISCHGLLVMWFISCHGLAVTECMTSRCFLVTYLIPDSTKNVNFSLNLEFEEMMVLRFSTYFLLQNICGLQLLREPNQSTKLLQPTLENIPGLNPKYLRSAYDVEAYVLLIAMRPSNEDLYLVVPFVFSKGVG